MFVGSLLISMALKYTPSQNHLIREYLKIRDETEWGFISWDEFDRKIRQLNQQYDAILRSGA